MKLLKKFFKYLNFLQSEKIKAMIDCKQGFY